MKSIRTSWAILAAAAVLSVSPSLRAQTNTPPAGGGARQGRGVDQQMTRLNEQLKLTDEQKPKVKAVLEDQNKKAAELRNEPQETRRAKMQTIREEESKKMKEILTPDQFKKYEELQAQRRGGAGGAGGAN